MSDWGWRLAALLLIVVSYMSFSLKSHIRCGAKREPFLRYTTGYIMVKTIHVTGSESVCLFTDGSTVLDAKKMTLSGADFEQSEHDILSRSLNNGDVVEFSVGYDRIVQINFKQMTAAERILLGIPLDPDKLSMADWISLPGVGKSLAAAIVSNRQNNGAFYRLENVSRVPGIGTGRINRLKKYF